MELHEAKRLILQREIFPPADDSQKFDDRNYLVDPSFEFGKNNSAIQSALALVRAASKI